MAQRVNVVLVDDLDGSEAEETVSFGLDGSTYEIDLSSGNAEKLREVLAPYVGHARKASGGRRSSGGSGRGRSSRSSSRSDGEPTPAEIRAWARENGFEVPERGRVSGEVRSAYDAAH